MSFFIKVLKLYFVVQIILFVGVSSAQNCKNHDECGICGFCAKGAKPQSSQYICTYPFPKYTNKECITVPGCYIGYCGKDGKCSDEIGFTTPRCFCDVNKFYGRRCENKVKKGSESNFASGVAILHTVPDDKDKLDTPYTVTVYATTLYSGKDLKFLVTTKEGYRIWCSGKKGSCKDFSSVPIYTFKKICYVKDQCVQSLPDCNSVYTCEVMFPYKQLSDPEVFTLPGGSAGYVSGFTIVAFNNNRAVFKYTYLRMINYEDFGITDAASLPEVKLHNCAKTWDTIRLYQRKSSISLEAQPVKPASGQKARTSWSLWNLRESTQGAYVNPRVFQIDSGYHWNFKPFQLAIGEYRVQLVVSLIISMRKVSNYDQCYFEIISHPLVAHIDGGTVRAVLKSNGLSISGESSHDPNEPYSNQSHLQFTWSCKPQCDDVVKTKEKMFFIKPDMLEDWKTYHFRLMISSPGIDPAYASQTVHVKGSVGISIYCVMNCFDRVYLGDPLLLEIRSDAKKLKAMNFRWSYKIEDGKEESVDEIRDSNYPQYLLCIKPNSLEEGKGYYFQANVDGTDLIAGINITVNKRPSNGTCSVFPLRGIEAKTLFTIECTGFVDEDDILIYEYYDKRKSDPESEYSGKMMASNADGILENFKLTRGIVVINIYNTFGHPAISTHEVELQPYQASLKDVEDIFKEIDTLNDYGETETALLKAADIPDILTGSMKKSYVARKLIESIRKVSFTGEGNMKIGLSILNNTIAALTKGGDYTFEPSVLKDFTELISALTRTFKYVAMSDIVVPIITGVMLQQLTIAFLDVIENIVTNRNMLIFNMTENDMSPSEYKDTLDTSTHLQNVLDNMATALAFRHRKRFNTISVTSNQWLSVISTLSDSPSNLLRKLNQEEIFSAFISPALEKELQIYDEVIIESMKMKYNPFWSDRKDISTDLMSLNLYRRKRMINRIVPITNLNAPIDLFLSVNKARHGSILLNLQQLDSTGNIAALDNRVTVLRIDLPKRSQLFLEFTLHKSPDELRVFIGENIRPDYEYIMKSSKIITTSAPIYEIPYHRRDRDVFIYIGILPGSNVSVGNSVSFTLNFHYNLCLTLIRHYWVSEYCSIGDKTNSTMIHCRCTHLSIMSAIFAVPPNDIDPFNDISLFLTVKDNALVVTVVLIIVLVFFLLCLWACFRDRKEWVKRCIIELEDNFQIDPNFYIIAVFTGCRLCAGTSANVGIQLQGDNANSRTHILKSSSRKVLSCNSDDWFLLRSAKNLGVIESIHLWHDNFGPSPDWFCEKIMVFDIATGIAYTFFVEEWLALELDEYSEAIICAATTDDFNSRRRIFLDNLVHGIRNSHMCGSIIVKHPRHATSRLDHIIILMTLVMLAMLISIAFFYVGDEEGFDEPNYSVGTEEFIISLQTFIVSALIISAVILLFKLSYTTREDPTNRLSYIYARTAQGRSLSAKSSSAYFKLYEDKKRHSILSPYRSFVRTLRKSFKPLPLLPVTLSYTPPSISRSKMWYILAWVVSVFIIFNSCYLIMLYGLKLGYEDSKVWLTTATLAMFDQIIIVSPIRIIIFSVLLASSYESLVNVTNYKINVEDIDKMKYAENRPSYISLLKRRSQLFYRPLTLKEVDIWKQKRQKRQSCISLIELAVVAVFVVFLCLINHAHFGHHQVQANLHTDRMVLYGNIPLSINFDDIFNIIELQGYLQETLISSLYKLKWYNLGNLNSPDLKEPTNLWAKDCTMKLMGPPILRQLRVYPGLCTVGKFFENTSIKCIPQWSKNVEDTDDYEFGWKTAHWNSAEYRENAWCYTEPSKSSFPSRVGKSGTTYHGGGYITNLSPLREKTRLDVQTLIQSRWMDQFTSVVFVTFTLYSVNYNLFTQVTLTIEHLPSGSYLTRAVTESVQLNIYVSHWKIGYLIFLIFFLSRALILINRKGLYKYISSFVNLYQLFLLILGFLIVVFFVMHIITSERYIDEFFDQEPDDFFPFDDVIFYGKLAEDTMILLFCGLALYFFTAWYSSRRSFIFYYMVTMSCKYLTWMTILLVLFILLVLRMISFVSNFIIPIPTCIWRWSRSLQCAVNNVVLFGLIMVLRFFSVMIFVIFSYECKLAKIKRHPVRTHLIGPLIKSTSKDGRS